MNRPTNCKNCGAVVPASGVCEHCGTDYREKIVVPASEMRSEMRIDANGIYITVEKIGIGTVVATHRNNNQIEFERGLIYG